MKRTITLVILTLLIFGCEPKIDEFEASSGEADFTSYVAIGNSLTAGYTNGELYKTGQQNSFPAMLAEMFQEAGGGKFNQPLMKDDLGLGNKLKLGYQEDCLGETSLSPLPVTDSPSPENMASIAEEGPFHNMGVPGAKSFHLLANGYGQANPYFGRFASETGASVIGDAMLAQPSFFTCWIGNNDVLTYATAGGEADSITSPATFVQAMTGILQTLTSNGPDGAIANIPNITEIPFFTTVPYNAITLDQAQAEQLNTAYAQYNAGAEAYSLPSISFEEGENAMIIEDDSPEYQQLGGFRQITEDELVLLTIPQDSLKCAGWGTQKPVPNEYILDETEIQSIMNATTSFNQTISNMASTYDLALVDMNGLMQEIASSGLKIDGVEYTSEFVSGSLFSLDGIHLTGQGYAIVANRFVEAINQKFNASLPKVNVTQKPGIQFP